MMKIVKIESIAKRYVIDIDENIINDIYPNATVDEIEEVMRQLAEDELEASVIIEDAYANDVNLNWNYIDEGDWWPDRSGDYSVAYEVNNNV